MDLYNEIINKKWGISIVGLGYVGLPLAVKFSKVVNVIGFDINKYKISEYKDGIDYTGELERNDLLKSQIFFTNDEKDLKLARFHIIAVPTPISIDKLPDLTQVIKASKIVARNLTKGSIVVYESTVYPGVTEEICIPILEKVSNLKCGIDFKVGYSPERINPGDKVNTLENIKKIVSGIDKESLEIIAKIYELVICAGVYKAESIKIAETAKVLENSQRDINIAFINEVAMICNKMNIDTDAVIRAAETKWNFLKFKPGLVGGHCISIDPYYFIYKAEKLGYHSQIILTGRKINDSMSKYVVENTIKKLITADKIIKGAKVGILGFAFKENCSDIRNTKIIDIIDGLKEYGIEVIVHDPIVNPKEVWFEYRINLYNFGEMMNLDAMIIAVPHKVFLDYNLEFMKNKFNSSRPVLIDIKSILNRKKALKNGYIYWSL